MENKNESLYQKNEIFLPSFLLNDIEYDELDKNLKEKKEDFNPIIKG